VLVEHTPAMNRRTNQQEQETEAANAVADQRPEPNP
jgi:hypothetical protein